MKKTLFGFACLLACGMFSLNAQQDAAKISGNQFKGPGRTVVPAASIERPADLGRRAHTHFLIHVPAGARADGSGFSADLAASPASYNTPIANYWAETPQSLACIYGLVSVSSTYGCSPYKLPVTAKATGGSKAIAIVDAYDYPTAMHDLNAYSTQFGLPHVTSSNFTVVGQTGSTTALPQTDPNCADGYGWGCWETEEALDIEMAHAMAPGAHIYLVEANDNYNDNLFAAVRTAASLVAKAGGGEVSMSWGGGEFTVDQYNTYAETHYDPYLVKTNVTFFASTGDSWGTEYPSVSPNVIAVGGTTLNRSVANGLAIEAETAWEDGGGGVSAYETRPAYQAAITTGKARLVPDVAAVANPNTGVWVYNSFDTDYEGNSSKPSPWNIIGGTSAASPLTAALVNNAGHFAASSAAELTTIYATRAVAADWRDVTYGSCGYYQEWFAAKGWDPCTGVGAPVGRAGK